MARKARQIQGYIGGQAFTEAYRQAEILFFNLALRKGKYIVPPRNEAVGKNKHESVKE